MAAKSNAREAALAKAREAAEQERDERNSSGFKSYIQGSIPKLEVKEEKAGKGTRIIPSVVSVLAYQPRERHHPSAGKLIELDGAMKYYKRDFSVHNRIGPKGSEESVVCPRSFNPHAECSPCSELPDLWEKWRSFPKGSDGQKNVKASIDYLQAQKRILFLVYDHNSEVLCYMDTTYGAGKNPNLGMMLEARLAAPLAEDYVGFWFNDGQGYAWMINWVEDSFNNNKFYRPISLDFVPEKQHPIPKEILKQVEGIDLADLLVRTSSKHVEALHLGIDEEDIPEDDPGEGEEEEERPEPERPASSKKAETKKEREDSPPDPDPEEERWPSKKDGSPDVARMDKAQLLDFAKEKGLKDDNGKEIYRVYARRQEMDIRNVVAASWELLESPFGDGPAATDDIPDHCKFGHEFGVDFCEKDECQNGCPDDFYEACMAANDAQQ